MYINIIILISLFLFIYIYIIIYILISCIYVYYLPSGLITHLLILGLYQLKSSQEEHAQGPHEGPTPTNLLGPSIR
jgi:hypothetical protein